MQGILSGKTLAQPVNATWNLQSSLFGLKMIPAVVVMKEVQPTELAEMTGLLTGYHIVIFGRFPYFTRGVATNSHWPQV